MSHKNETPPPSGKPSPSNVVGGLKKRLTKDELLTLGFVDEDEVKYYLEHEMEKLMVVLYSCPTCDSHVYKMVPLFKALLTNREDLIGIVVSVIRCKGLASDAKVFGNPILVVYRGGSEIGRLDQVTEVTLKDYLLNKLVTLVPAANASPTAAVEKADGADVQAAKSIMTINTSEELEKVVGDEKGRPCFLFGFHTTCPHCTDVKQVIENEAQAFREDIQTIFAPAEIILALIGDAGESVHLPIFMHCFGSTYKQPWSDDLSCKAVRDSYHVYAK